MEIITDPYTEHTVRDFDVVFNGDKFGVTLRDGDELDTISSPDWITISMHHPNPEGTIVLNKHQVLWYAMRFRVVRTPIGKKPAD